MKKFESKTLIEWVVELDLGFTKLTGLENETNARLKSYSNKVPSNINKNGEEIGLLVFGADGYALTPEQLLQELLTNHEYCMNNCDIESYDLKYSVAKNYTV